VLLTHDITALINQTEIPLALMYRQKLHQKENFDLTVSLGVHFFSISTSMKLQIVIIISLVLRTKIWDAAVPSNSWKLVLTSFSPFDNL